MKDGDVTTARAGYHHGDLKAALVRAGIEMLEDVGLEKLSLRGIAARVGVSHTAPKNHFNGLRGLLSAIATEGFRRHRDTMISGITPDASKQEHLHAATNGYVQFAQANPALFQLMFSPDLLDQDDPALIQAGQESYAVLEGIADGLDWTPADGSDPSARQTELMLWSMVHGYAHLLISGKLSKADPASVPHATALMPQMLYSELDAD